MPGDRSMPTTLPRGPYVNRRSERGPSGPRRDVEHAISRFHRGEGDEAIAPSRKNRKGDRS